MLVVNYFYEVFSREHKEIYIYIFFKEKESIIKRKKFISVEDTKSSPRGKVKTHADVAMTRLY